MKTKIRQTVKAELIGMAMAATIFNDQTTLDRINTLQGDTNLFNQTEFDALTKGLLVQLKELVSKKN